MSIDVSDVKYIFNEYIEKDKNLKIKVLSSFLFCVIGSLFVFSIIPQTSLITLNESLDLNNKMLKTSDTYYDLEREIRSNKDRLNSIQNVKPILNDKFPLLSYISNLQKDIPDNKKALHRVTKVYKTNDLVFNTESLIAISNPTEPVYSKEVSKIISSIKDSKYKSSLIKISVLARDSKITSANFTISIPQMVGKYEP